jgi:RNA polymerase sigma-70 factor (family 1)
MENNLLLQVRNKKLRQTLCKDFLPLSSNGNIKVKDPVSLLEIVLISRLKTGDYSAFSYIFSAYYKDLVFFATKFTRDIDKAEEIVQDSFVKLWEGHESLIINVSLKSYLLKLIQNKCIDWYRHKKIKQAYNDFIMESLPQQEYDTDNYFLYSELQEQIDKALNKLPETVSEAFRMNRYSGLKYNEIAEIQGVSVRTIEDRIGKALHLLRKYLKEYFPVILLIGIMTSAGI